MKFSSPVTIYLSLSVCTTLLNGCAELPRNEPKLLVRALRCWLLWHLFIIQFKTRLFAASKGLVLMLLLRLAGWQLCSSRAIFHNSRFSQLAHDFWRLHARLSLGHVPAPPPSRQSCPVQHLTKFPHGLQGMVRVYEMQMCGLSLLKSIVNCLKTFNLRRYQKIKRKEKKRKEKKSGKKVEAKRSSRPKIALHLLQMYLILQKILENLSLSISSVA